MLAKIFSFGVRGVQGYPVLVELDLANGLPAYATVGLPDSAVRESRERVTAAVRNSGYRFPGKRITVNLAPAQARKEGTHFDLPIALALLSASGQLAAGDWSGRYCFIGELALDGALRPVPGVTAMALQAREQGFEGIVIPAANAAEARAVGLPAYGASSLREVTDFLRAGGPFPPAPAPPAEALPQPAAEDLSEVKGQSLAKKALEIAAAGGHNILLIGPPGVGKSMLARRLVGLLPPLTPGEALEVTRVHSVSQKAGAAAGLATARPFRAPHHTSSHVSLIGGGPSARPGETSLAHGGVLFLDELAEFNRPARESLRQPLEEGRVCIARARDSVEYPARFLLAAATNPCPCGWRGHPQRPCVCTPPAVAKYLSRLSGPLLDRIDLQVELSPLAFSEWAQTPEASPEESTAVVRARVLEARKLQRRRFESSDFAVNAYIPARLLRKHCFLDPKALELLELTAGRLALSARGLDRLLRVARTIADLDGSRAVRSQDLAGASRFRSLDSLAAAV